MAGTKTPLSPAHPSTPTSILRLARSAPACQPHCATDEPTFVIAGAQRCGTTWLWHMLAQHAEVFMARPLRPEPKFFLADESQGRDKSWYQRTWFVGAAAFPAAGEKSTSYLESPDAPRRMRQMFPALKVIVILRHPVERSVSNYLFSCEHGLEQLPFDAAVRRRPDELSPQDFPGVSVHPLAYVERSCYAPMIERYRSQFSSDRLHIVLHDDIERHPLTVCRDVYAFLGVNASFRPTRATQRFNASAAKAQPIEGSTLDFLFERFADSTARLEQLLGRDLSAWRRPVPQAAGRAPP